MKFSELQLEDSVLEALDAMRFEECTPVQEHTIPVILQGRDLIGVAQTGTGKTAAYLLPVLNQLSKGGYPEDSINCIIMAPTRELAQQIDQQMDGFSYFMPASSVAVYGGNDGIRFAQEKTSLTQGADVVIATPGRLISHLSLGYVDLSRVSFFILDEADRMLDMGFYDDIMQIVKYLPKERQTIMFSATMPNKIQQLANTILNDPVEVKLAVSKPAETIVQSAYVCYENQKLGIIRSLFKDKAPERVIIFASSKLKVKEVTASLRRMKMNVGEMHSDLDQSQRDAIMHEFKNGRINILVATDIVARGIDIDDIRLVINYDVPHDCEDYVHRIGRTARANNDGCAITFISEKEQTNFKTIEDFLEKEIFKIPVPEELGEAPEYNPKAGGRGGRGGGRGRGGRGGEGRGEGRGGRRDGERGRGGRRNGDSRGERKNGERQGEEMRKESAEGEIRSEERREGGQRSERREGGRGRGGRNRGRHRGNGGNGGENGEKKPAQQPQQPQTTPAPQAEGNAEHGVNGANAENGEKRNGGRRRNNHRRHGHRPDASNGNASNGGDAPKNDAPSAE
jgi:superfamily II DNA/RNA helicase